MNMEKKIVEFIDSGDTIIDESTEVRNDRDVVVTAKVIPGADRLLRILKEQGYRVALVADGYKESFDNIYRHLGLIYFFEQMIVSSVVGTEKPSSRMFETALEKMNLTKKDCAHIIMVGNNIERDIRGANSMGIISVLQDWTPRYRMTPESEEEIPDYIIHNPLELLELLRQLERDS